VTETSKPLDGCRVEGKRVDRITVTGPWGRYREVNDHLRSLGFVTLGMDCADGPGGRQFVLRMERENPDPLGFSWA
jgi:hypothetical protein